MSPRIKWGDILLLASLSVCLYVRLSVCLSVRHASVSALYLLKVKPCMTVLHVHFITLKGLVTLKKRLGTNVQYHEAMCRAHIWPRSLQGQCHILRSNTLSCQLYTLYKPLVGFTYNSAQMWIMMSRCAVRMFDIHRSV